MNKYHEQVIKAREQTMFSVNRFSWYQSCICMLNCILRIFFLSKRILFFHKFKVFFLPSSYGGNVWRYLQISNLILLNQCFYSLNSVYLIWLQQDFFKICFIYIFTSQFGLMVAWSGFPPAVKNTIMAIKIRYLRKIFF